jgi:thiol-disulfide isomerase/thioredoxin
MHSFRRSFAALVVVALLALPGPGASEAASLTPFTPQAFSDAQTAGQPIVVFVHAAWCITCRRQQPVLETLSKDPAFAGVLVLVVNYDKDKDTLRALGVTDRSTLIAYNGKTERTRSSFVTDAAAIRTLFDRAL